MSAAQESIFYHLTTDAQVVGIATWAGLLVTIAGFWMALTQIRKVRKASDAAGEAMSQLVQIVRSQEQSAKINAALGHLTSAHDMMKRNHPEASAAYLSVGRDALIAARELTDDDHVREQLGEYVVSARRLLDDSSAPGASATPSAKVLGQRHSEISKILAGLGVLAARLNASLSKLGVSS